MPTQSDVLLMENYSSASRNRKKNNFREVSVKVEFSGDNVSSDVLRCPEVRKENNN